MRTMKISLPETLKVFVDSQVSGGDYGSRSEYVRELLRKEKDRVRLRELIMAGRATPLSKTVWDAEHFEKMRQRAKAK